MDSVWLFWDKRVWWCIFGAVVLILVFLLARRFLERRKNRYIGFGWVLWWDKTTDLRVCVVSRLLESPSGRAEVGIGDFLVSYKGERIQPGSEGWFIEWIRHNRPKLGEEVECILVHGSSCEEYSVTLVAEYIQGPIPVYGRIAGQDRSDPNYTYGMAVCTKTGQLISTRRLSDTCIEEILLS